MKVVHKLAEIGGGLQHGKGAKGVTCDANVTREIATLAKLNGLPGVVELLSWSEGHFDAHLFFPAFQHSLLRYLTLRHDKALPAVGGKIDFLPPAAWQLLNGFSHVHSRMVIPGPSRPRTFLSTSRQHRRPLAASMLLLQISERQPAWMCLPARLTVTQRSLGTATRHTSIAPPNSSS